MQIDEPQGLRSGEVAEVLIRSAVASADLVRSFVVPAIALIDARADQGIVFVVDGEGKARSRAVETGGVTDDGVVILKGIAEGDRVITRGASMTDLLQASRAQGMRTMIQDGLEKVKAGVTTPSEVIHAVYTAAQLEAEVAGAEQIDFTPEPETAE